MFYCSKCGVLDEKGTLLTHRCPAINTHPKVAINIPPAINRSAINNDLPKAAVRKDVVATPPAGVAKKAAAVERKGKAGDGGDRTGNRRSREDYNAYMREYMRRKRGEGH